MTTDLITTALDAFHRENGAKMVPFAGYSMPMQYELGIMGEHLHTREHAGLFDVSHMGQLCLSGVDVAEKLETLVTGDIQNLGLNRLRYSLFTNDAGGILDDLMITKREHDIYMVVNAAVKARDIAHLRTHLEPLGVKIEVMEDKALIALQGPRAAEALAELNEAALELSFMTAGMFEILGIACWVSRSGYTGEDGFEISVPSAQADRLARALSGQSFVKPIGLGARDSLRLEAGLCLYGHDISEDTTPVEAALNFAISKKRREGGGFPGADVILPQLTNSPARLRVGLKLLGRQPAREGALIVDEAGSPIGSITSGGFAPSVGVPIAMGYVPTNLAQDGVKLGIEVRGKILEAEVCPMPFVPNHYVRKTGIKK